MTKLIFKNPTTPEEAQFEEWTLKDFEDSVKLMKDKAQPIDMRVYASSQVVRVAEALVAESEASQKAG